jgi:hypothetical protein
VIKLLILLVLLGGSREAFSAHGLELHFHRYHRLNEPLFQTRTQDWFGLEIDRAHQLSFAKSLYLKANLRYYRVDGNFNYSLPEAHWNYRDRVNELTIGRKIVDWNPGEAYWGLNNGLNGRQGFTLLGQEQEGLTGVHFDRRFGRVGTRFFMSYLHIPSLNPSTDIRGGEIITRSEWVRRPPERTSFRGVELDIFYELDRPSIDDVIFKKSLGAAIDYTWDNGHILFFSIYKPENNLRANAFVEGILTEENRVIIKAEPIVNHHVMIGGHVLHRFDQTTVMVGFDITDPNASLGADFDVLDPVELREANRIFETDDFVIEPSYERESYARTSVTHEWPGLRLGLSYIRLMSKNFRGDDFFTDTVKWKSAAGLYGDYSFADGFLVAFDYKYDFSRKDEVLKAEASYTWPIGLSFLVGGELLKAPNTDSYWTVYRANDTAYARLSYQF